MGGIGKKISEFVLDFLIFCTVSWINSNSNGWNWEFFSEFVLYFFGVFVLSAGLNPGLDFSINIMENGAFDFFFFNLWGSGICTLGLSVGW